MVFVVQQIKCVKIIPVSPALCQKWDVALCAVLGMNTVAPPRPVRAALPHKPEADRFAVFQDLDSPMESVQFVQEDYPPVMEFVVDGMKCAATVSVSLAKVTPLDVAVFAAKSVQHVLLAQEGAPLA
jgi:hypothetical protein